MTRKVWDQEQISRLISWGLKSERANNKIYNDFLDVNKQTGNADPNWSTMDLFVGARGENPLAADMKHAISELEDGYAEIEVVCENANRERNLAICTIRSSENKSIYSTINLPANGVEAVAKHALLEMEGYHMPGSHLITQVVLDL